jgi:hypothetical protein
VGIKAMLINNAVAITGLENKSRRQGNYYPCGGFLCAGKF